MFQVPSAGQHVYTPPVLSVAFAPSPLLLPPLLSLATVSLPATIVTSSMPTSVAGHMMYPSQHTVMYASTPTLTDGGLAVLNAFSQGTSAMQVSHAQGQDSGETPDGETRFFFKWSISKKHIADFWQ